MLTVQSYYKTSLRQKDLNPMQNLNTTSEFPAGYADVQQFIQPVVKFAVKICISFTKN